ncbi:TonB-dependent receptor plug domain-containing protein [Arcicella aurantiaca]|uniref:TonB-dependent receptor plug domain-containing protein n=1 Tax=Arcicella aurantiaca TaxID=591202 RepID=UPI00130484BC|nr:TonB-dependent receptor [Arcicella aurantiaca]
MKTLQKIFLFVGLCFAQFTFAQNNVSTVANKNLDEVIITGNKTEQKQSQTGKVVTILSDSILQKYQSQTITELLTRQAGFMIVGSQNTSGTNQDVYLRGASTGNTLILIDGMPVYDPSGISSNFDLNMITVAECERIEILKGAQSTLYGSDAVAGVINIFTKKGKSNQPISGSASVNAGSYGTYRATVGINGAFNKGYYNVQYTRLQSDGFSAAFDKDGNKGFDNDGIRQNNILANVGYNLTKNLQVKFRTLINGYKNDIDAGAFADEKDYTIDQKFKMFALGLVHSYAKGKLTFNYGYSKSERNFVDDSTSVEKGAFNKYVKQFYGGDTHYAEIYNSLKINDDFELVAGADYRFANTDQTYVSYSQYGKYASPALGADTAKTNIFSVYASGLLKTNAGFFLELGGRYNNHSLYGSNFTYSFNPSYLIDDQLKVFVNLSSGFKAPSLYQLYSPYGNKGLKPEKSVSTEAGIQAFSKDKNSNIRVLYFDRNIKDVIYFESLSKAPYGRYINFDKQHDYGWEVEGKTQIGKFNLWANVTLLQGAITTQIAKKDTTYNNLFRRPESIINFGIGYSVSPKLYVSTNLRSIGKRTDRFYNSATFKTESVTLNAYTTLDFYAEYKFTKNIKAYVDLKNITDEQYFDVYGYNSRRFNFMTGLSITF